MASTINPEKLLEEIKYELDNLNISINACERIKKVWIANEVKIIDSIDATVNNIFDDILKYRKIIPNKLDIIRNMNIDNMNEIIKNINFKNISIVKMIGK